VVIDPGMDLRNFLACVARSRLARGPGFSWGFLSPGSSAVFFETLSAPSKSVSPPAVP